MVGSVHTKPNSNAHKGNTMTNHINAVQREGRGEGRRKTSDGLLHFGHRPKYKPQYTKLNSAHRQTNKTYIRERERVRTRTRKLYFTRIVV